MLKVNGVSKTFNTGTPHEIQALREIHFSMNKGEFVAVIGTNGSGKSTLLNAIAGSFPVDSGTIYLANQNISNQPEHVRAKYIGRVFQNPFWRKNFYDNRFFGSFCIISDRSFVRWNFRVFWREGRYADDELCRSCYVDSEFLSFDNFSGNFTF